MFLLAYLFLFLVACQSGFCQEPLSNGDTLLWDGMENTGDWSLNTPGQIKISSDHKTEGQNSFQLDVRGNIPAHGIILKRNNADLDVTFAKKIFVDVYNSGPPCKLAVAFDTDGHRESISKQINSGLNKNVTFEVGSQDFKVPFGSANIASSVMFVIYPSDGSVGPIYFDNIRISKFGGLKSQPPGISPALEQEIATPPIEAAPAVDTGPYSILNGSSPGGVPGNPPTPPPPVTEHKTLVIFGVGLAGLAFCRKKSLKK